MNCKFLMPIVALSLCLASCDDDDKPSVSESSSFDSFVKSLDKPEADGEFENYSAVVEADTTETDICSTTEYVANEQFSELVLLDPTSDVIYVGSLLDGTSVDNGSYRPLVLDRAPLTISTSFENHSGKSSVVVENPSLSSVRDAIKGLLADSDVNGATSAATSFEIKEVRSAEEVGIAVGASVSSGKVNIANKFNFSKTQNRSHFLVKFVQTYYTVDMDLPKSAASLFAEGTTAEDLKAALNMHKTVPAYVSSVKYGRIAYFAIESSEDSKSFANELEASFKALSVSASVGSTVSVGNSLSSSSISGTVIGGSASDAVQTISGMDGMLDFIKNGGNYSKESPAAIVSFTLRKLSDNSVYKVLAGGKYQIKECTSRFNSVVVSPSYFYGVTHANDVYGQITAQIVYSDGTNGGLPTYIFNKDLMSGVVSFGRDEKFNFDGLNYSLEYDIVKKDIAYLRIKGDLTDRDGTNSHDKYYLRDEKTGKLVDISIDFKLSDIENNLISKDSDGNVVLSLLNDKKSSDDDYDNFYFAFSVK